MKAFRFATLIAVFIMTSIADGRLLETIQECDARYGVGKDLQLELGGGFKTEKDRKWAARMYSARGLDIQIVFENETAALVRYSNEPPLRVANSTASPANLSADEVTYLRGLNLLVGTTWRPHTDRTLEALSPSVTLWISSDKLRYAAYDRDRRQLFIASAVFWDLLAGNIRSQAESSAAVRFEGL